MKVPRVGPSTGEGVPVCGGLGETGSAAEPVESSPLEAHPDECRCLPVRPAAASLALVRGGTAGVCTQSLILTQTTKVAEKD